MKKVYGFLQITNKNIKKKYSSPKFNFTLQFLGEKTKQT